MCVARLKGAGDEPVERLYRIDQGRWIVESRYGLYQFAESGGGLSRYEGIGPSRISHIVPLGRDLSLILSSRETSAGRVFRAQNDALKVQEVNGSESLRFTAVGRLTMGAIIGTDRGLYRVDSSGTQFQEATGADTGRVSLLEQVDEGGWLVAAALGLFRYDNRNGRTERVSGADTGEVTSIERLADGGWLAGAEKGVFRIDPAGRSLTALTWKKAFRVAELRKLADGAWLIRGEQGLFVADPQGKRLDALDEDGTSSWRIQHSDDRGALLQTKRMTYVLAVGAKKAEFFTGELLSDMQYTCCSGWLDHCGATGSLSGGLSFATSHASSWPCTGSHIVPAPFEDGRLSGWR
jgi:hypothetical protein